MSIADKVNKIVNPEWFGTAVHTGTRTAESILGDIAAELSMALGNNFSIFLHPGHELSIGQQFQFILMIPEVKFSTVFFQAFIPKDHNGFPTTIAFFEEEQLEAGPTEPSVYQTADELKENILAFFEEESVRQHLRSLAILSCKL